MRQFPIKTSIESVPGGMMIVPLLLGSLVATFDEAEVTVVARPKTA